MVFMLFCLCFWLFRRGSLFMAGMKKASEKKRLLVATLVAVLVATLADVFFLCFLGDMISGFVYDVLLSNIIFTSF